MNDYIGKQAPIPLLPPGRSATPTPERLQEIIKALSEGGPPRIVQAARCRYCGGEVSVDCAMEEEPDIQLLNQRMQAHQERCWQAVAQKSRKSQTDS